jgi:hypothetical protein
MFVIESKLVKSVETAEVVTVDNVFKNIAASEFNPSFIPTSAPFVPDSAPFVPPAPQ